MLTIDEILDDFSIYCGVEFNERNVNVRSSSGESPLHWMATLGDHIAISLLLKNGADVSATDTNGDTPLHYSVRHRQQSAANALLQIGANAALKNNSGFSAHDLAMIDKYMPIIALFKT